MVCTKCQKLSKKTELATPGIKRKADMYYGSPASSSSAGGAGKTKSSATLGSNGIGKSKLLGVGSKNPYALYESKCKSCKTKIEKSRTYCLKCAYKANACAMCGKDQSKEKASEGVPVIQGQKFSAK
jgi:hypothetical protein